jgi:hypothetical protein
VGNLTTLNTNVGPMMLAGLFNNHNVLSLIPRVVVLVARSTPFAFYMFVRNVRLGRTYKVCFHILRLAPRSLNVGILFITITSKTAVIAMANLTKMAALMLFERRRWCMTFTPILSSSETNLPTSNHCRRTPQTILDNIILQSIQCSVLACLSISH